MANFVALLVAAIPAALILGFGIFIIIRTLRERRKFMPELKIWEIFLGSYVLLDVLLLLGILDVSELIRSVMYFILAAIVICFLFYIKTGKEKVVIVESIVRVAMLFKPKPPK